MLAARLLWLGLVQAAAAAAAAAPARTIDHVVASRWLPDGYGYDWSRAGYAGGERAIPTATGPVFGVRTYGARGLGDRLEDGPVQAALRAALRAGGGTVQFHAGTYLLSRPLYANASNIVFRGTGRDATRLVFTKSLSQVFGVQWGVDNCTGKPTGLWTSGGALIVLSGQERERRYPARKLATVVVPRGTQVQPGDRRLQVDSTARLRRGQWVELVLDDASTSNLPTKECEYRKNQTGGQPERSAAESAAAAAAAASPRLLVRHVPPEVERDEIFQLAVLSKAGEEGEGALSVAQAAVLDARHEQGQGEVGIAAAKSGTVAAWLYGDNRVDSGGPGAVNAGSVRFAFRVAKVGRGWIEADRDIIYAIKPAWTAALWEHRPGIQGSGVEHLTIAFRDSGRYEGHFSERGYNAVQIANAQDCWVRSVRIVGADNAIFLQKTSFSTLQDIVVTTADRTIPDGKEMNGHHGIAINAGQNVLVTSFKINVRYYHDVHVVSTCKLAVVSNGAGQDLNMEHHRAAPHANLFSDIDVGANTRPFSSGGRADRGAHSGRGDTFWNVFPSRTAAAQSIQLPSCDFGPYLLFVLRNWRGSTCPAQSWRVARWRRTLPRDLHAAQVRLRRAEELRRRRNPGSTPG